MMKIVSVRATPVSVPANVPCAWSLGTGLGTTRTILELGTDDGLVGLGECGISRGGGSVQRKNWERN